MRHSNSNNSPLSILLSSVSGTFLRLNSLYLRTKLFKLFQMQLSLKLSSSLDLFNDSTNLLRTTASLARSLSNSSSSPSLEDVCVTRLSCLSRCKDTPRKSSISANTSLKTRTSLSFKRLEIQKRHLIALKSFDCVGGYS